MKPPLLLWVVSPGVDVKARWQPALRADGWPCSFVASLDALFAGRSSSAAAMALVDIECLSPRAECAQRLRQATVTWLAFGSTESMPDAEVIWLLESGANDVVSRVADGKLVAAKLKAQLRTRQFSFLEDHNEVRSPLGEVKIGSKDRRAWHRPRAAKAWKPLCSLTDTEFHILRLFLRNPNAVIDRPFILEALWGKDATSINSETLDRHVQSLRKKLGSHGAKIAAVYGEGYAWREGEGFPEVAR